MNVSNYLCRLGSHRPHKVDTGQKQGNWTIICDYYWNLACLYLVQIFMYVCFNVSVCYHLQHAYYANSDR